MRDNKPDKLARFVVFFRASLLGMLLSGVVAAAGSRFKKGNNIQHGKGLPHGRP